jgi:arylformamidase
VILPGIVIDVPGRGAFEAVGVDALPPNVDVAGKAVLFRFGWDIHWGRDEYQSYPFISRNLIDHLVAARAKLVGVDTVSVDSSRDMARPAHTILLREGILVVENLTNLGSLLAKEFRFFAVPIKARRTAAMPVRAFAEVLPESLRQPVEAWSNRLVARTSSSLVLQPPPPRRLISDPLAMGEVASRLDRSDKRATVVA